MTTMTTLNDVRAAMIARGYPAEEVDAMLDLAGRMILEGSLASKDDVTALRDEFTAFKIDVATQFAELRAEMDVKFAELRAEMDVKFAELRAEIDTQFAELRAEIDTKFAEQRTEMNQLLSDLRAEMNERFAEQRADADARERRIVKWVAGAVIGGIAVNVAVIGMGIAIVALLVS